MAEEDEENTAFYNNQEVFCYTKMSFGLKNVRATYQRLVDKAFEKQINRNLEVYIDDLVIKSYIEHEILTDIEDTFRNLRRINMKLNPKKCTFGAEEGAFLVHVVSMKGIKPEKRPRTSIHGQVLVDLIAERPDEGGPPMEAQAKEVTLEPFEFDPSNNEVEYEALVAGLRIAEQMGVENLVAKVDTRLVANQINGSYEAKEQSMIQYLEKAKDLIENFKMFSIEQYKYLKRKSIEEINPCRCGRRKVLLDDTINRIPRGSYPNGGNKESTCNQDQGKTIYHDQRRLIQKFVPRTMVTETKSRNLYGTTSCADLECQEKSYPTNECSSDTTHSETGAKSSTSSKAKNDEGLLLNLDILEERKEKTAICEAKIKAKMEKYYNTKVRSTTFHPGDFVYRSNEASHAKESEKLGPKWEGLYEVVEALRKGAYKLRNGSGDILPRTWNVKDLKMLSLNFHHVSILDNVKPH
ncbi:reverse transcriptase domain-containing protein [Tanacetum coccineum]